MKNIPLPAEKGQHLGLQQSARGGADGEAARHGGDHAGADSRRREFVGHDEGQRQRRAETESGQRAQNQKLIDRRQKHRAEREQPEKRDGGDDDLLAAEYVRQGAEHHRPDSRAEGAEAEHRSELLRREMPGRAQGGRGIGERLRVEAVEELDQPAQDDDAQLKGAEPLRTDDFGDIDSFGHCYSVMSGPLGPGPHSRYYGEHNNAACGY